MKEKIMFCIIMTFVLKIRDCNSKRVLKIFATPKGFVFRAEQSEFQLPKRTIASDFKASFFDAVRMPSTSVILVM